MRSNAKFVSAVACTFFVATMVMAQERATKEEAKAIVDAAVDHIKKVGPTKAYADFTHDKAKWTKKDLYLMVYDAKGIALAHGASEKIVGKDMSGMKDANGNAIVPALQALANQGGGWLEYEWPDPITKKMAHKTSYSRKLPTQEGFVAAGVYR